METNWPDEARSFAAADPLTDKIGQNVADFLAADMKRGIIPSTFLPLQSGVGNIANAVLGALGRDKTIPAFEMYTEVIQNSVIGLIREGRVKFGSACSLTVTNDCLEGIYRDMDFSATNWYSVPRKYPTARKLSAVSASSPSTPPLKPTFTGTSTPRTLAARR